MVHLTFANAMTFFATIVAGNDDTLDLGLFLRTVPGNVAQLAAIAALGETSLDDFASIFQSLEILFGGRGPELSLARASRLVTETVSDRELLLQIALEVHVGEAREHGRLLNGNHVDAHILNAEGLFKIDLKHTSAGFSGQSFAMWPSWLQ
ncbi:hypothetical protein GGR57DRAFT_162961 [Xylariaceae sp. FL1272]|nr:hypothetical protein GGR57DRAFT_162961 [Xylariaceae sp. FL1272]